MAGASVYVLETTFALGQPGHDTHVRVAQKLSPISSLFGTPDLRMQLGIAQQAKYFAFAYPASVGDFSVIEEYLFAEEEVHRR